MRKSLCHPRKLGSHLDGLLLPESDLSTKCCNLRAALELIFAREQKSYEAFVSLLTDFQLKCLTALAKEEGTASSQRKIENTKKAPRKTRG